MLTQMRAEEAKGVLTGEFLKVVPGRRSKKWQCRLQEMLIGEYLVVPLTSAKTVKAEAYWMNTGCENYIRKCAGMEYALFSICSRSGERLATLGLTNNRGSWRFDYCFGPSCTEVMEETLEYFDDDGVQQREYYPTELYYIAHEVVRLMNAEVALAS